MIFIFHSENLSDLRSWTTFNLTEDDVVLFFLTGQDRLNSHSMGMFRLKDGWSTSGKTDDLVFTFPHNTLVDMYWQRIYKGALVSESSGIQLVAPSSTYTFTHSADATMARQYSVKEFFPTVYTDTLTVASLKDGLYAKPIDGAWRNTPFDLAKTTEATPKLTLAKLYTFTRTQLLDLSYEATGIQTINCDILVFQAADSSNISVYPESYDYMNYAKVNGTWVLQDIHSCPSYIFSRAGESTLLYKRLNNITYSLQVYDNTGSNTYQITSPAPYHTRIYGDAALLADGALVCSHSYFEAYEDWKWDDYYPYAVSIHIHYRAGSSWSDMTNDNPVDSCGYNTFYRFMDRWNFDPYSTLYYEYYYSTEDLASIRIVNVDRVVQICDDDRSFIDFFPPAIPFCGAGPDDPYVLIRGCPQSSDTVLKFTRDGNGRAVYNSQHYTFSYGWYRNYADHSGWRGFDEIGKIPWQNLYDPPAERNEIDVKGLVNDCFIWGKSIQQINPTTLAIPFVAHSGDIRIEPDLACIGTPYDITGQAVDSNELTLVDAYAPYNTPILYPTVGVYTFTIEDIFESTALIHHISDLAVSIDDLAISVNIPSLTEVRIMMSVSLTGQTYTLVNGHWVEHNDYYTAVTLANFLASDFSLLIEDLGGTLYMHIGLLTLDGTVSPEFISSYVEYTRGNDFKQSTTAFGQGTDLEITAISSTQTGFKNLSASAKYLDCSIHKLI